MERGIASYHPAVSFIYFSIIIGAAMLYMNPVFIGISLISSIIYGFILNKDRTLKILVFTSFMMIFIIIANGLFVNRGVTVLFYLRGGNAVTLESLSYGAMSGLMMAAVVIWFSAYNEIITSDKFLYIFGRVLPSIALMASMTLRLIPNLIEKSKEIAKAQKTLGLDYEEGNLIIKIKSSMRILSILVTWALEDAVQTADSMKARGYGLKGRSSFSIFKFIKRDGIMLGFISVIAMFLIAGYSNGYGKLLFYPTIEEIKIDTLSIILYIAFLVINIIPILLEIVEAYRWKYLK